MWLRIEIDLSMIPENGVPAEAPLILREVADWMEKRPEPYEPTGRPGKLLRNFESEICGKAMIG